MKPIMEIVKKNLASIICGVVALAAVIAIFFPIGGYWTELQTKADARKGVYSSIQGVLTKQRHLPTVGLDPTAQPTPLTQFPTDAAYQKGQALVDSIAQQAKDMVKAAETLNLHTQLIPTALPDANPDPAGKFRRDYIKQFDFMSDDANTRKNSFPVTIMKAGYPPNDQQVSAARKAAEAEIDAKKAFGPNGQVLNQQQIDLEKADALPKVAETLKTQSAQNCKVYVEPTAFHQYQVFQTLKAGDFPTPPMIFNAQVGLWVQQDVCNAINEANAGATDVTQSAVKHLIRIDITDELFHQGTQTTGDAAAAAPAANADPSQALTPNFALSLTGRTSNGLYDVIPITLHLEVDAEQLPKVLRAFSTNRFMDVLNVNLSSVDLAMTKATGFFYGDKPVVAIDLQCEDLLLRSWTTPLMPLGIKQALGVSTAASTAAPGAPAQ